MFSASFWAWIASTTFLVNNVIGSPLSTTKTSGQPVVDLGYSKYQGITLGSGVNQYLGIRYAAPPLGDLRFRAPAEPLMTNGIQNAIAVRISSSPLLVLPLTMSSFNLSVWELVLSFRPRRKLRIAFSSMCGGLLLQQQNQSFPFGSTFKVEDTSQIRMQTIMVPP